MSILRDNEELGRPETPARAEREVRTERAERRERNVDIGLEETPAAKEAGRLSGWDSIGADLSFSISSSFGNARLYEVSEALREVTKELKAGTTSLNNVEVNIHPMDPEEYSRLSTPLVILTAGKVGGKTAGFFTFAIDTGDASQNVSDHTVRDENIQVRRLPSNAIRHISTDVADLMAATYPNHAMSAAAGDVIPATLDIKEEGRKHLRDMILNAINACGVYISIDESLGCLNVTRIKDHTTLTVTTQLVKTPNERTKLVDEAGRVVRGDIRTRLATNPSRREYSDRRDRDFDDVNRRVEVVSEGAGYVDLQWEPIEDGRDKTCYVATFVATHLYCRRNNSIGGQLLAMYSTLGIFKDDFGLYSLAPDRAADKAQAMLQDIGILNVEAGIGGENEPIPDLISINTRESEVRDYINLLVHPTLSYAIDIDQMSSSTWRLLPFLYAGMGDDEAWAAIRAEVSELTNGHFDDVYDGGNPFEVIAVRPSGQYYESNHVANDIRVLDYVAVSNLMPDDPRIISDYQDYQYDLDIDTNVRLHHLNRITETLLPTANITGITYRIDVNLGFLRALQEAMSLARLNVNFNVPSRNGRDRYVSSRNRDRRAYEDLSRGVRARRDYDDRDNRDKRRTSFSRSFRRG